MKKELIKNILMKDKELLKSCISEILEPDYINPDIPIENNLDLINYLKLNFPKHRDCYIVLLLDRRRRVIHKDILFKGTEGDCPFYMRTLYHFILTKSKVKYFYVIKQCNILSNLDDSMFYNSIERANKNLNTADILDYIAIDDKEIYSYKRKEYATIS